MNVPQVAVLTPNPSPLQVQLLDQVHYEHLVNLRVVYVTRKNPDRLWRYPDPVHEHIFLVDGKPSQETAARWVADCELFVAADYTHPVSRQLIRSRTAVGKPWCYWGERPGYSRFKRLGKLRRWWYLEPLRHSHTPIWGMGKFGIEGWKSEFGLNRRYINLPYHTDLHRLHRPADWTRSNLSQMRFIYVGSLIPRKGADLVAQAFAVVARQHANITLDYVGTGPLEPSLRELLAPFGDRVRFHGFRGEADLLQLFRQADILAAPSRHDGWGMMVPEGLATGLPVISTDRTGAAVDYLQHGVNGWLIPAGNLTALKSAMSAAAVLSPEKLTEMSEAALASVADYTLAHGAQRFVNAVTETLRV